MNLFVLFVDPTTYSKPHIVVQFILQIQGQFKIQPRGVLFAGAEVSEPMKLGLLAKGYVRLVATRRFAGCVFSHCPLI